MCPVSVFAETSLFAEKCLDGGHQKGQFQQMLNLAKSVNNLEHRAAGSLKALLSQVPAIELQDIHLERQAADREIDILAHIIVAGRPHSIVCEVKASGQPRHVRIALLQLRNYIHHIEAGAIPFLIAPYFSDLPVARIPSFVRSRPVASRATCGLRCFSFATISIILRRERYHFLSRPTYPICRSPAFHRL